MLLFWKYQGTGNDFIIIDNRDNSFNKSDKNYIATLCDRRFGIGADGFILIEEDATYDFKMVYYNADGKESTMCGNGGRCLVAFAKLLGLIDNKCIFNAIDGVHHATITKDDFVALQMIDVNQIEKKTKGMFLNTGSPHHVEIVRDLSHFDVFRNGKRIRESIEYKPEGTNVNFVEQEGPYHFRVRTFERGVEDETLSCGTGATAVAIAMFEWGKTNSNKISISVEGGDLEVEFEKTGKSYKNVWLKGPTALVFKGQIE